MRKKIFFAIVSVMFLRWSTVPVLAQEQGLPADACYTTREMISDVTVNFMTFQDFHASRCDEFVEKTDKPTVKKYLSLHQEILAAHNPTFDDFTAELPVFLTRYNIDGEQYLLDKVLKLNRTFPTPGVSRAGCEKLYGYMVQRRESWDEIIKLIVGEIARRDAEYPKCE